MRSPELPVVAIVGRPNVGKSTLFNRIAGRRVAVVEAEPGVTRDRNAIEAEWRGVRFSIVDTGGWEARGDELTAKVTTQAEAAMREAAVVLFVVDVNVGVTEDDLAVAKVVRRLEVPVLLVVNKVDDQRRELHAWEFASLGLGDPITVSALHGRQSGDLLDAVVGLLDHEPRGEPPRQPHLAMRHAAQRNGSDSNLADGNGGTREDLGARTPRVAIVGRPNAGKSTLFNRLVGEERAIVHDIPGTTRDAIDTVIETALGPLCVIDTAGMRRPSRTQRGTEHYAVLRALSSLETADVALLVIDATVGVTHQDQRLAERIEAVGCPVVVLLNKWDLVKTQERELVLEVVADRLAFIGPAPVLRISARTGRGVQRILPALQAAIGSYRKRIPTGALNRALQDLQAAVPPKGARIRYGVQGAIEPPTFTLFASARLAEHYLRYVERGLRERFGIGPTPIKLRVRVEGRTKSGVRR